MNDTGEKIAEAFLIGILNALGSLWPLILALIALALAKPWLMRLLGSRSKSKRREEARYISREYLLTAAEKDFHESLQDAVGQQYWICPKVRLSDLVDPDPSLDRADHQIAWNQISQKHVDFVLCHPGNFQIAAMIELDDSSHNRNERRIRDALVDTILHQCGIPILHVSWARTYSPETLASDLNRLLIPADS